jgi:Fe-S-cluster containining protein
LCCKVLTVPLSDFDINRLEQGLNEKRIDLYVNLKVKELIKNIDGCFFLSDGKCSIYDYRPDVCRLFPYSFKVKGNIILLSTHELARFTCFKEDRCENNKQLQEATKIVREIISHKKIKL